LKTPPPLPPAPFESAVFFVIVLLNTLATPEFQMPPPDVAASLPLIVELKTPREPFNEKIAPPASPAPNAPLPCKPRTTKFPVKVLLKT
jgi:hypothetical protein